MELSITGCISIFGASKGMFVILFLPLLVKFLLTLTNFVSIVFMLDELLLKTFVISSLLFVTIRNAFLPAKADKSTSLPTSKSIVVG